MTSAIRITSGPASESNFWFAEKIIVSVDRGLSPMEAETTDALEAGMWGVEHAKHTQQHSGAACIAVGRVEAWPAAPCILAGSALPGKLPCAAPRPFFKSGGLGAGPPP